MYMGFVTGSETSGERPTVAACCAECGAPLADDQRYCLRCGTRRGPVPPAIAATLGTLAGTAAAASAAATSAAATGPPAAGRELIPGAGKILASISPRAASLAVMAMLAFGVVVGSGASSLAGSGTPLLLAVSPTPQAAAPSTPPVASSPGGSVPASAPASAPAAPAAAPAAPQQQVTVTVPSSGGGGGGGSGGGGGGGSSTPPGAPTATLPPIKHVFVVMLSDQGYAQSFGPGSTFPYLAKTLVKQGELLPNYYAVGPSPLSNAIAMISGQGPTVQTAANCSTYTAVTPGKRAKDGQIRGDGCVYPTAAQTLPDQLTASGMSWKAYVEGMDSGPTGTTKTCRHPQLNSPDPSQTPQPGDPYVTWRNPFVYFQSLVPTCDSSDVALPQLSKDLKSTNDTPALSYIVPSPCNDGSGMTCPPASSSTTTSTTTSGTTSTSTSAAGTSATSTASTGATPGAVTASDPGILPALDSSPTDTTTPTTPPVVTPPSTSTSTGPSTTSGTTGSGTTISGQTPTGAAFMAPADEQAAGEAADNFLRSLIPKIEASPAYKDGGLIVITFDEAPQSGPHADPSACCDNPAYPNLPASSTTSTTTTGSATTTTSTTSGASTTTTSTTTVPGTTVPTSASTTTSTTTTAATTPPTTDTGSTTTTSTTTTAPAGGQTTPTGGGGQVGLLLISKYVTPGSSDATDYFNHYSLLASIEELFSLQRLGYASDPSLPFFGPATYNNFSGSG
jgi:Phosphoesterase family